MRTDQSGIVEISWKESRRVGGTLKEVLVEVPESIPALERRTELGLEVARLIVEVLTITEVSEDSDIRDGLEALIR